MKRVEYSSLPSTLIGVKDMVLPPSTVEPSLSEKLTAPSLRRTEAVTEDVATLTVLSVEVTVNSGLESDGTMMRLFLSAKRVPGVAVTLRSLSPLTWSRTCAGPSADLSATRTVIPS